MGSKEPGADIPGLREEVLRLMDMSREPTDEALLGVIDRVLMSEESRRGMPLSRRLQLRKALFDSFRRYFPCEINDRLISRSFFHRNILSAVCHS